jgi:membrane-bound lytic murein transglycosylase B
MNLLAPRPLLPLASPVMRNMVLRLSTGLGCAALSAAALATPASSPLGLAQAYQASQPAYNPSAFQTAWQQEKARLAALARSQGVRESTIQAVMPTLQANSRVIQLDRAQRPTGPTSTVMNFGPYLGRHITSSLINRGQSRYYGHWNRLSRIEARTGVDPAVIIAIYGKETSYGSVTGSFDLLEALATLAYEGRRRHMFEQEFVAALKLLDQGVRRSQLKGSYAGATGYPQFMPSVALRLRADGDGDGYADIWRNEDDAFASIANYLQDAGWKRGVPWGAPVRIPPNLNRAAIRSRVIPPRCPAVYGRHSRWLTVAEWRRLGVHPGGSRQLAETELVALMETPGGYADGYFLTTNYRAILDYNCSNFYALGVGLLANAIARR